MNQMDAFRILASADRQLVLHELVERDSDTTIAALSQQVAARRHKTSPGRIGEAKVESAHVRLVHDHLPKLEEHGIIDVNWDENEVSLEDGAELDQLLEVAEEMESWPPNDLLEHPSRSR